MLLRYYPGGCTPAVCIPSTPDQATDLIEINYLISSHDELSIEIIRLMASG